MGKHEKHAIGWAACSDRQRRMKTAENTGNLNDANVWGPFESIDGLLGDFHDPLLDSIRHVRHH